MDPDELPREWDVVVVGAGIAGAMGALHLARIGLRVLLVEKSAWPRAKACGGCLNAAALRALASSGIELREGSTYHGMRLYCLGHMASLPLPPGIAISRTRLDAMLVQQAIDAGVRFVPVTRAILERPTRHGRRLVLRNPSASCVIEARVVLDCGGLATRLVPDPDWRIAPRARIGVAAILARSSCGVCLGHHPHGLCSARLCRAGSCRERNDQYCCGAGSGAVPRSWWTGSGRHGDSPCGRPSGPAKSSPSGLAWYPPAHPHAPPTRCPTTRTDPGRCGGLCRTFHG